MRSSISSSSNSVSTPTALLRRQYDWLRVSAEVAAFQGSNPPLVVPHVFREAGVLLQGEGELLVGIDNGIAKRSDLVGEVEDAGEYAARDDGLRPFDESGDARVSN